MLFNIYSFSILYLAHRNFNLNMYSILLFHLWNNVASKAFKIKTIHKKNNTLSYVVLVWRIQCYAWENVRKIINIGNNCIQYLLRPETAYFLSKHETTIQYLKITKCWIYWQGELCWSAGFSQQSQKLTLHRVWGKRWVQRLEDFQRCGWDDISSKSWLLRWDWL